jgi:hypothetical protein
MPEIMNFYCRREGSILIKVAAALKAQTLEIGWFKRLALLMRCNPTG